MNHQQWKEWVNLLAYEELDAERKRLTEEHIKDCGSCREDWDQLKRLHRVMDDHAVQIPNERLLNEARQELRAALRYERNRPTASSRVRDMFSRFVPSFRVGMSFAAMLAIGLFAGYMFAPVKRILIQGPAPEIATTDISNIRFVDADPSDGQIEFAYDAVKPMRVKGNVNSQEIQYLLTQALMHEQNAGVRLRAVNTVGANKKVCADTKVKQALITTLKQDSNDGVRKEAMAVLKTLPFDQEIQDAFVYVLQRDANPALRIDAIKSLEENKIQDQEMLTVLKEKSESDDNSYIRRRAKDFLQEVSQQ
ncbi:HEAT repeat domain-containing protein [bacterium]|nr:HEAT repeat domain-containing protein [bacterium]